MNGLFDLSGKVALVTGGGAGLGRVFCETLAKAGAKISCVDLQKEWAEETVQILQSKGSEALSINADLTNQKDVKKMLDKTIEKFGRLDIAVNNAGVGTKSARIHEISIEDWDRLMNINLRGVFLCMKEELGIMLKQQSGCIINLSSILGLVALDCRLKVPASYTTSKHAIVGLTKQAAVEYASDGIRVNAIAPGWHLGTHLGDEMFEKATEKERGDFFELITQLTPMKRGGDPNELGGLLLYLASDKASGFLTGQIIASDGGWTAW